MSEEEPEEREERSGCAGAAVIAAAVLAVLAGTYAASPEAFVLGAWAIGWGAIVWAAKKPVSSAPNPAPPPAPERGSEEEPQVTVVRDKSHPNRWVVAQPSSWMNWDPEKEQSWES